MESSTGCEQSCTAYTDSTVAFLSLRMEEQPCLKVPDIQYPIKEQTFPHSEAIQHPYAYVGFKLG